MTANQYIQSVLPGRPFGDGLHGALTISADTTFNAAVARCAGSIGSKSLSLVSAGGFVNGDVILIIQMRGTAVGGWEVNYVVAGGGGTTLTLLNEMSQTYTNSGLNQAQVIQIKRYTNIVINSGKVWYDWGWNQSLYGIMPFAVSGQMTITGQLNASNRGYYEGDGIEAGYGYCGEGTDILPAQGYSYPTGNWGGGGSSSSGNKSAGGGGGGNGGAGGNGTSGGGDETYGRGGVTVGNAALTNFCMGGGGGGGGRGDGVTGYAGSGGFGGGGILGFIKLLTITGSVVSGAENGEDGTQEGSAGGGGAGGSILFKTMVASIGTNLLSAPGGNGGTKGGGGNGGNGGAGGYGRMRLDYSRSLTGSCANLSTNQDLTLVEGSMSSFFE